MRLQPVRSRAGLDLGFDAGELEGVLHGIDDDGAGLIGLAGGHFEEELVMHLQEHASFEASFGEGGIDVDHGELDHVGGGALNGRVHRHSLSLAAHGGVGAGDVTDHAAALREGLDVAVLFGLGDDLIHEAFDAGELLEVVLNDRGCLGAGNAEALAQAEGADAIDDAEIDHLRRAAHLGQHAVEFDAINTCCGGLVNVVALREGFDHRGIAAERGHDAEFDL